MNQQTKQAIGEMLRKLYKKLGRAPAIFECEHAGISEKRIRKYFGGIQRALIELGIVEVIEPSLKTETDLRTKIGELRRENLQHESKIRELEATSSSAEAMRELIHAGKLKEPNPPDWLIRDKAPKHTHGIPVLFISDIHFDEIVKAEQVSHANSYNRAIASRRIKNTFQTAVNLTKNHMKNPKYDGIVCAFGGDLLSGNIHEELKETNEGAINLSIIALTDLLIAGLELLLNEFDNVFCPCVVGNHGRQTKQPRAKGRVHENFEWLIYENLRRYFKNEKRIQFLIPDGADCQFSIYGRSFLLTHGDQFKGGTGISGLYTPLMLGMARKQKRNQAIGRPFDVMMVGHWHTYVHTDPLIVNGSIKGIDEYSYQGNFGAERPQQALWIEHPRYGATIRMPVLCEPAEPFSGKDKIKAVF